MAVQDLPNGFHISEADWKETPPVVRALVLQQHELIGQLIKRVEELEARHIRLLYSEELKEAGYEVITAENGNRLLERIEDEKPSLIILDIKMVDYNGLDILQDIRNRFYDLPIILSTAYDTFKEDMKSIAADFYVVKSFDLTELKKKIATALETSLPS